MSEDSIIRFLSRESRPSQENLEILLDHSNVVDITPRMLNIGLSEVAFNNLTKACKLSCKVTPDILESQSDIGTLKALLQYQPGVEITEGVIIRILSLEPPYGMRRRVEEIIELLSSISPKDSPPSVTKDMFKAVKSLPELEFLLGRLGPARGTLQDIALWICEKDFGYFLDQAEMLACVLRSDPETGLSPWQIEKVILGVKPSLLDPFLVHMPSFPITERLFLSIFREYPMAREEKRQEFAEVLRKRNKKIVSTQKIRDAIDVAYQKHTDLHRREMLYSLQERDETLEKAEGRRLEEEKKDGSNKSGLFPHRNNH
ncbi:ankyrin repeat and KH domain protein [Fusarium beomiforme]|uniref:Ankyrin repeat and KH domain protein n=1 Tax=Fusarium beomiforme TaxID=44412 RepID=A0A9P5AS88_9HYPO|nr:ankyrin repeat and KH domain protein [Fusarium beomiforme]